MTFSIKVFRIARIMRIFKLARRSVGLQAMAHTVRTSWKDLGLLFMLVGMGMLVFGSLLYYIENSVEDTSFISIPAGMWWAVQTLTSLGYGDYWPGELTRIGALCRQKIPIFFQSLDLIVYYLINQIKSNSNQIC